MDHQRRDAGFVGFALGCGDMALTYVQESYQHVCHNAVVLYGFGSFYSSMLTLGRLLETL